MRKKIYICSPCRGKNYEDNIDNAITWTGEVFRLGYLPVTPHIYFTRFLSDENSEERAAALDVGKELLQECSEVWVFGIDNPSEGMKGEIAHAIRLGIPVRDGHQEIMKRTTELRMKEPSPEDLKKLQEELRKNPPKLEPLRQPKRVVIIEVRGIPGGLR